MLWAAAITTTARGKAAKRTTPAITIANCIIRSAEASEYFCNWREHEPPRKRLSIPDYGSNAEEAAPSLKVSGLAQLGGSLRGARREPTKAGAGEKSCLKEQLYH